jgi:hypothetical protein
VSLRSVTCARFVSSCNRIKIVGNVGENVVQEVSTLLVLSLNPFPLTSVLNLPDYAKSISLLRRLRKKCQF